MDWEEVAALKALRDEVARLRDVATAQCQWTDMGDDFGGWETGCGEAFTFAADGIEENGFNFCPYCGGRIDALEVVE